MGLDNRAYLRGLAEVEKETSESTRRLMVKHRTQIDDSNRREWEQARRRKKFQQDFARGWQVATVAAAAGIASVVTTLDAAAQRNPVIAQQLGQIGAAAAEMRANIGEDIFGLGGSGLDEAIRKVEQLRGVVVDFVAVTAFGGGGGHVAAVNAARAADRQVAIATEQARNFNELQLELQASIAGDQSARETLLGRRDDRRINQAAADQGLTRQQTQELRELTGRLREQIRSEGADSFLEAERERLELARMELRADGFNRLNPNDPQRDIDVELLRQKLEITKATARINANELLNEEQRLQLIKETTSLIEDQSLARVEALKREANERKTRIQNRFSDRIADDRIGVLRATGQGGLADVESLFHGFQQRRREIESDSELNNFQRNSLLTSSANLLRAQLAQLRNGRTEAFLEAGLAGGATLRRQILGADGTGGGGDSPVVQRIDEILEKMDQMILGGGAVAVAAP